MNVQSGGVRSPFTPLRGNGRTERSSAQVPSPITEAQFTAQVIQLAHLLGWRIAHFRPAQTTRGWRTAVEGDGAGYPDVTAVRGHRLVVAELKAQRGAVTPEQRAWLDAFAAAGAETYVWRPSDFDAIAAVLR